MFEKGQTQNSDDAEHNEACESGMARCLLKVGDIRRFDTFSFSISINFIRVLIVSYFIEVLNWH